MSLVITPHRPLEADPHIYFCSLSTDGKFVACALGNGSVCLLDTVNFHLLARGAPGKDFLDVPATCIQWMPVPGEKEWKLVSSSSAGGVMLWDWDASELALRRGTAVCEPKNEVMTVDVSPNGLQVLTAGSDRIVRLYDAELNPLAQLIEGVNADGTLRPTHVSRIFSVRFVSDVLAVSAGWDSPIQMWDLRARQSNRQVVGLLGVSDCLEPVPSAQIVLVASPKSPNTLQIFESVTGRVLDENSKTVCSQLDPKDRVTVCRFHAETGHVWCLTSSPPSVVVLSLSSGVIVARAALTHYPLNTAVNGDGVVIGCKNGVLLQVSLTM
ncbi:hypothetical protein JKF63_02009 [Porcisia hertigi]|uniref:Uncharacterized protein n=1 Tax=Porcisia hertigi TaxID=2761500 RepID=A0A836HK07_9TRYP|nr:hypothetical protein JKF63_02009 [Porcisia hertigi]